MRFVYADFIGDLCQHVACKLESFKPEEIFNIIRSIGSLNFKSKAVVEILQYGLQQAIFSNDLKSISVVLDTIINSLCYTAEVQVGSLKEEEAFFSADQIN